MYEPYHIPILQQLKAKRWIYKEAIKCDLNKKQLDEALEELAKLNLIHLGVGNVLLSSKGDAFLKASGG
jgi:hypothetical protein